MRNPEKMDECYGGWYILNGKPVLSDTFDNSLIYEGESVYEVLRLKQGVPVFFGDHISRLETSADRSEKPILRNRAMLRNDVIKLSELIKRSEANLKIVFNYKKGLDNCLVYYIEPVYPSADQYSNGVRGILFRAERKNPASKVINKDLRSEIYHKLILENAYEALLVNRKNEITEGSRSNIFFIKGEALVTSPDEMVLGGITRKHLLAICSNKGIPVEYRSVNAGEIADYESAIMTGTSPVVLPFSSIGDISFDVNHPLISMLREEYLKRAEASRLEFINEKDPQTLDQ